MAFSVGSFVIAIILTSRVRKYCKTEGHAQLERKFLIALFVSIGLGLLEMLIRAEEITKWIWYVALTGLVVWILGAPELRKLRGTTVAFIPFIVVSIIDDATEMINGVVYQNWKVVSDYAVMFAFVWMLVVYITQSKQLKNAEQERIKRQHEDELNKALANRKAELEVLVAERTAELTEQKESLEQIIAELQATQKQLVQSEKMASLGELTAGIAHEIQNPLNFVNNFSELNTELIAELKAALEKGDREEAMTLAKDIDENEQKIMYHGKRADGIVKGMLQHSRSSTGIKEPVDINVLADEYLRLSYHGLRAKNKSFNAKMETALDQDIGKVNLVAQDIGRVILNLLNNAFYAVAEKKAQFAAAGNNSDFQPTVKISTRKLGSNIELRISDNGNGIPSSVIDKIFQPFFTTKPTGQGTGLGLSLSYDIITKGHGGELSVTTKEGEGTTFIITIPA